MFITLNEEEIIEAIKVKVSNLLVLDACTDISVDLDFNLDNIITATIDIPTRGKMDEVGVTNRSNITDPPGKSRTDSARGETEGTETEGESIEEEPKQEINEIASLFGHLKANTL